MKVAVRVVVIIAVVAAFVFLCAQPTPGT